MNISNKKKNPFEILGLRDGEMSLVKVENAYRTMRKNLDDQMNQGELKLNLTYEDIEKAFQELISYIDEDTSQDPEEVVISASFMPKVNNKNMVIRKEQISIDNNLLYMHKDNHVSLPVQKIKNENITRPTDSLMNMKNTSKRLRAVSANKPEMIQTLESIISSTESISGSLLRILREKMSVSIDEMSNKIKVSKIYLEAIESDSFDKLPAEVYAKGFFNSYLNYIGLDRKDLVEALMEIYRARKRLIKKR